VGRCLLICRLTVRDLRHRPVQAVLLLLAITAATATLTMGLALNGVTSSPYLRTKAATNGPDVTASVFPSGPYGHEQPADAAQLTALAKTAGVIASSGPYPLASATLRAGGHTVPVQAEGRDEAQAAVDQPYVTQGSWVRPGGAVLERTFAGVLGVTVGDSIRLNGRTFRVTGLAVTAAIPAYPGVCYYLTCNAPGEAEISGMGLVWLTQADARGLATKAMRRHATLVVIAGWLPVPLLIGLRLIARRPRRAVLGAASTAVAVTGIVAVLAYHHAAAGQQGRFDWFAGLTDPETGRVSEVMAVLTIVLVTLAAVNAIVAGWATALDARQQSALSRALGGTPWQVTGGLSAAQVLPALPGALVGIPLGILLFMVANSAGAVSVPPPLWLAAVVLGALAAVGALTAIPASFGARQPVAPILQSEAA
jgi:hypothetical protein